MLKAEHTGDIKRLYLKDACPRLINQIAKALIKSGEEELAGQLETIVIGQRLAQGKAEKFDFPIYLEEVLPYELRRLRAFVPEESINIRFEDGSIRLSINCMDYLEWFYALNMPDVYAAIQKSLLNFDRSRQGIFGYGSYHLAILYDKGARNVQPDSEEAFFWVTLAEDAGYKGDQAIINAIKNKLTSAQISDIRSRMEVWNKAPDLNFGGQDRGIFEIGPTREVKEIKGRRPGFPLKDACPQLVQHLKDYFVGANLADLVPQIEKTVVKSESVGMYANDFWALAYPEPWWTWEERKAIGFNDLKDINIPMHDGNIRIVFDEVGRLTWIYFTNLPEVYAQITKFIPGVPAYKSAGPELEKQLLDMLRSAGINDFETNHKDGAMTIKVKAVSDEVGPLFVHVTANETILFCNVAHSHINLLPHEWDESENPEQEIIEQTAKEIIDFVNDRIVFSESRKPDGGVNSRGWGKFRDGSGPISQSDLDRIMKKRDGLKVTYWVFSRKLGTV
jgi:hypothetical protein